MLELLAEVGTCIGYTGVFLTIGFFGFTAAIGAVVAASDTFQ